VQTAGEAIDSSRALHTLSRLAEISSGGHA